MTYKKRIVEFEISAPYNGEKFDYRILSLQL